MKIVTKSRTRACVAGAQYDDAEMTRWRALLVALWLCAPGCKPEGVQRPPDPAALKARSELMPEADRLVDGLLLGRVSELHATMSPSLKARVRPPDLAAAGERLRVRYGNPLGIVEERTHREGDLVWYSGVVLHAKGKAGAPGRVYRLVLYQFALDEQRALDRLLVREHLAVNELRPPARRYTLVTRIHFFGDGEWTVTHGGKRAGTNYHHGSRGQRYAYDIVVMKGGRSKAPGADGNKAHYCYGLPLLAPAPGTVVKAINDVPDNPPGITGRAGGNGVVIDHGFGEFSALWHMIPGSVRVKVGDKVELGQDLGRAGNSGRSSGPHVHFHVSTDTTDPKNDGIGLPAPFVDIYVDGSWRERHMPVRGERVRRTAVDRKARPQALEVLLDASM